MMPHKLDHSLVVHPTDIFGSSGSEAIDDANGLAGDDTSSCGLQDNSWIGDWRPPDIRELHSLMDYGHAFPTLLLLAGHPFNDVQTGGINELPAEYWTSTSTGPGDDGACAVSLSVGWVERFALYPDSPFVWHVWPVRGGLQP